MEYVYESKNRCSGCAACLDICPVNAIEMKEDDYGFMFPKINQKKCIDCEQCKNTCPFQNQIALYDALDIKVSQRKNLSRLHKSASGGAFAAYAEEIIKQGGAVIGCKMDNENNAIHCIVNEFDELETLYGSKYVQSSTEGIFKDTKELLDSNKIVLFSGTPCQVAAIKKFLKKDYDNLITVDIICHGTPSNKMFKDYLDLLMKRKKIGKIEKIVFRDKDNGWSYNGKIIANDKNDNTRKYKFSNRIHSYYSLFLDSETYRDVCYECKFACRSRCSDITIGDAWGLKSNDINFNSDLGTSLVIINTEKGNELVNKTKDENIFVNANTEQLLMANEPLNSPSKHSKLRTEILNKYKEVGYLGVDKIFIEKNSRKLPLYYMWSYMPSKIQNFIRKVMGTR